MEARQLPPIFHKTDLMGTELHGDMLDFFLSHETEFSPARVGDNQLDTTNRVAVFRWTDDFPHLTEVKAVLDGVFPDVCEALEIPIFSASYDLQFQAHLDGGFHRPHPDHDVENVRKLAFIYYFHTQPKGFDGGQLRIYAHAANGNAWYDPMRFHTIPPTDNSVIFFPVEYYHEVLQVTSHKNRTGFDGARLSFGGWISDRG